MRDHSQNSQNLSHANMNFRNNRRLLRYKNKRSPVKVIKFVKTYRYKLLY